ncbi:accessory gene regulator B family protein [Lutibacter sp. B2]|nr:accessory gene regulator B family protein [Lutibacter sp. B2]
MINIEKISRKILTMNIVQNIDLNPMEKSKAEYGLSIFLGIVIEFLVALIISCFIKTSFYLWIIMLSSMSLRIFIGEAHCSSYDRCFIFTLLYFIPASIFTKFIHYNYSDFHILMFCMGLLILNLLILLSKKELYSLVVIAAYGVFVIFLDYVVMKDILLGVLLSITVGFTLQSFSATFVGKYYVMFMDELMKRNRI